MDFISNVIATARETICEDDYMSDGLLYCGKCNTPKQYRLRGHNLDGMVVPCLCKCAEDAKEEEHLKKIAEARENRIMQIKRECFIDKRMMDYTFERDDESNPELTKIAKNYAEHFTEMRSGGKGLLLYGSVGTGKTFAASCIANALTDRGIPCLVTNFARLVNTMQGMYSGRQDFIDNLNAYDLLVIDDLSAERDTEYMGEIVQNVIDSRYLSGKPLIATTNLSMQELLNPSDVRKSRIYSRIYQMCVPYEVKGKDRRIDKLINDDHFRKVLGIE